MNSIKKFVKTLFAKNTLSSVFWFSLLGFLKPAISIFLLPLYLIRLSPEDYGVLALVGLAVSVIAIVANFRLDTAARTFFFDHNENKQKLDRYISQVYSATFFSGVFVFGLFALIGPGLFRAIFKNDLILYWPYGGIGLATGLLAACNTIYFIRLKNEVRLKAFFRFSIAAVLLTIFFQVLFIIYFGMTITGVLWGVFIPTVVNFLIILFWNPGLLTIKLDWQLLKPSILFGIPLLPFSFLYVLESKFDRFILEQYMSLADVGIYAILMGIVGLSSILLGALDNGLRPFFYQSLKNGVRDKQDTKIIRDFYLFVGLLALSGIIMVGNNLQIFTSNPKYLEVRQYFSWACVIAIPSFFVRFLNLILVYHKRSKDLTTGQIVKVIVMLVLMLLVIPKYGIYGALFAVGVSQLINLGIFDFLLRKDKLYELDYIIPFIKVSFFILVNIGIALFVDPKLHPIFGIIQFMLLGLVFFIVERKNVVALMSIA